jgi:lipid A ethanolaminephosphotransferase
MFFSKKAKNIQVEGKIKSTEDLIVVLAIGETSRQKNFSLYGYNRQTNPLLSQ